MFSFTLLGLRFKRRYVSFLFWVLIWVIIGLLFASIFDSASAENELFEELISTYPEGLFDAINISTNYLSSAETFLSGQFLTFYTLIGSIYGLYIGAGEVGGKIEDKTIGTFLGKGISRTSFYITQFVTNSLAIVLASSLIWLIIFGEFVWLTSQEEISQQYFGSAAIGTSLLILTWSSVGQALGVFFSQKIARSLGAGLIVFSFFLNNLGEFGGLPEWTLPLTPFYYLDLDLLRDNFELDWSGLSVLLIVSFVALTIGTFRFRNKNISL